MRFSSILALLIVLTAMTVVAEDRSFPASSFQPDLTPGYLLIEGDIQVPEALYSRLASGEHPEAGFEVTFWSSNTVPYDFVTTGTGAVSAPNQTLAINAMNAIAARTGVIFRAAGAGDPNRIRFQNSSYNNSPIGMQFGTQIINIANWETNIIICHELYHSLGFYHEQSRPDRGTFITVNTANICGSGSSNACTAGTGAGQCCTCANSSGTCIPCASNFNLVSGIGIYGGYDFDSFMHYGRSAFTCNGSDTITVNPPWNADWQSAIGQRDHFSYFDTITCRGLYPFPNDRWLDRTSLGNPDGTFIWPFNNTTLAGALSQVPAGGTLFIKYSNTYHAVGTYSTPVTIDAPNGTATLGN